VIYLDSAATTLQKPRSVPKAVADAVSNLASPGRGGHSAAMRAAGIAYRCRCAAAELFGVSDPESVVFTMNATHALNIAIRCVAAAGKRVVISGYEHNSVVRPLYALGADVHVARGPLFDTNALLNSFSEEISRGADAVVCTHVSNVFGYVLPIAKIAEMCRGAGVPLVIDASQSAGVLPVDMTSLGAAFIAMPGHKGLYGPQGTGLLLCGDRGAQPLITGGTGSASLSREMPAFLPDMLEAGTHNMPGIAGLYEGIKFVKARGTQRILTHERALAEAAAAHFASLDGVNVFLPERRSERSGVLSFTADGRDTEYIGSALSERGIAVRAGLHCAPLAHETAGTLPAGTVRVSFSAFSTMREVCVFAQQLAGILR